ncbi:uncharacterized protein BJX67DRAFT_366184 [Aspergillus lucknowensis]|uniref:Uncharacterized protein n=1 Tax=Aspergillus lucknowensis TaxID=176173 RepID=A0ABR4LDB3_9EURO
MDPSRCQSSQDSSNYTPRCQKRSCPHQTCPHHECVCPIVFWCSRCTRFWCDDCWASVDAHEPLDEELPGMKDHKKTVRKHARGKRNTPHSQGTISQEDTTNHSPMAQEEQEHAIHENHAPGTSSDLPNQTAELALQDYQMQMMLLEQQNKRRLIKAREQQEKAAQAPQSPTPAGAPQMSALQDYQMQMMLLEQQNKQRLIKAREEQEKAAQAPQLPTLVGAAQIRAFQDYHMQLITLLEQQINLRSRRAREELEKPMQSPHVPGTSSDQADQIELSRPTEQASATQSSALEDYQMQLRLLQQHNKKDLMTAKDEQ